MISTGFSLIPFYRISRHQIVMMDTGHPDERDELMWLLNHENYQVKAIVGSHAHIDHIGNNQAIKAKYGAIIAMPKKDAYYCRSIENLKVYYSQYPINDLRKFNGAMVFSTDIEISDNQINLPLFGVEFRIFHTPGHSLGHICIITPDNIAYLGDSILSKDVMSQSKMPYTFHLGNDLNSKRKLELLKCEKYILAHKLLTDDIRGLIGNNIAFFKSKSQKIYDLIEHPMTIEEIIKKVIDVFQIKVNSIDSYVYIDRTLRSFLDYLCETLRVEMILHNGVAHFKAKRTGENQSFISSD